jgi:hypothetical protein
MRGRRIPDNEWFEWLDRGELQPGDYGRMVRSDGDPRSASRWFNVTPDGELGILRHDDGSGQPFHQVVEHEDGTITVCPSIQGRVIDSASVHGSGPISSKAGWHGWLERGVWRSA